MNASADTYQVSTQATNHPVLGVHDAFRHGPSSAAQKVASGNVSALQARLEKVSGVWKLAAVFRATSGRLLAWCRSTAARFVWLS